MVREETMIPAAAQVLHMENREKLTLAGVEDVSGFDENLILLETSLGALHVRGEQLHIERIDLEAGQLELRGRIKAPCSPCRIACCCPPIAGSSMRGCGTAGSLYLPQAAGTGCSRVG